MNAASFFRFVKRNWKEILIIGCLLAVMGKMRVDHKRLERTYDAMRSSLQEQISGLHAIHEEELRRRDAALHAYQDEMATIEKRYASELAAIEADRSRRYEEYLHAFIKDPKQLAEDIEEMFGFEHHE